MVRKENIMDEFNRLYNLYNKGLAVSSKDITDLYNIVFNTNLPNTQCSTCCRMRLLKLKTYFDEQY